MKLQRSMNRWYHSSRIRKIIRLSNLSSYTWVTLFLLMLASCKVTHVVKCECKCPHIAHPSCPIDHTWYNPINRVYGIIDDTTNIPSRHRNVPFLPNIKLSYPPKGDSTSYIRPEQWYQKADTSNSEFQGEFHIPFDSSEAIFKISTERNFKLDLKSVKEE